MVLVSFAFIITAEGGGLSDDRVVMSPYDISAVAKILGLPMGGAYNLVGKGVVVPEPASLTLLSAGFVALFSRRRR